MKSNINLLSYNIYYKAMLGTDKQFLPQNQAHKNVKKVIKRVIDNNYIIALQEVECLDKILPQKISNSNIVKGKSGNDKVVTILSPKFKLIKSETYQFRDGRPIQVILLKFNSQIYLILNIHAPHEFQNFGKYMGEIFVNNEDYTEEIIFLLNQKIDLFLKKENFNINRIIILGDFNEIFNYSYHTLVPKRSFTLEVKGKLFNLNTDPNQNQTCCFPNIIYRSDYIFDSIKIPKIDMVQTEFPASDHLPIITCL